MYDKLAITENHLQILSLFTEFGREYYIREVQKLLGISPRTAQLILDELETRGILESKMRGKIKMYGIKRNDIAKNYLVFAEQYKKMTFLAKKPIINEIISKITPFISGIGLIFGSYVKGTEKKDSDLDILIVGSCNMYEIKKVSELYGIEISVKVYPMNMFEKNMRIDVLIKEAIKNHVIFINAEYFVDAVLRNG